MAIKIGHASSNENRKSKGGNAGDQTGREVCTRTWYNGGWQFVLRPKTSTLAEKSAVACEKGCANNKIGYDQNQRNTLYTQAKAKNFDLSKITVACETDCSAFMTVCAISGGAKISYGTNAPTTSTMKSTFEKSGNYTVLTDSKYLTSDKYLKRGDILVKAGSHTVMVLQNGVSTTTTSTSVSKPSKPSSSNAKANIKKYQQWLNSTFKFKLNVDGVYGENTKKASVKAWQTTINTVYKTNLKIDGVFGDKSLSVANKVILKQGARNRFVYILQGVLNSKGYICSINGVFDANTYKQVISLQHNKSLVVDGVVGAKTWNTLLK